MSADPLDLLEKTLEDVIGTIDELRVLSFVTSEEYTDMMQKLTKIIKTYGELCVMDYRSEKASDAISAAMHCWNPSNDHIKKKEGDPK